MATWSIEHIPANGGASTFASLGVWGFASLQMQFTNWGVDQAAVTTRGGSIAFEAAQFGYLDKLVVWRNGARFAHFWITGLGTSAQTQESRTYALSGPSWWLAQYAPGDLSSVTVYTAGAYIALGMAAAISAGAPVGCASGIAAALDVGCPDVRSAGTVLALVQEAARHVPFSSGWWDASGETPVLTAARRSVSDSVTLTIGTDPIETFGITPMPELQLKSVRIRFGWTGGSSYYYNTAGTGSDFSGPNRLQCALNYGTQAAALEAAGCGVAERVFADMSTLPWGGTVNLHATEETDIDPIRPGCALNLTGGRDEWTTMGALVQSVVWSVSPEANDCCTLQLGAPDHLGIQDYFSLSASVGSASGAESPTPPVDPLDPIPGTLDDLNGGTGGGTPKGSVAVQARGGAWTKVGFAAFDASDPSRRWLTKTASGTITYEGRAEGMCTPCQTTNTVSGSAHYDPATGICTSTIQSALLPELGGCWTPGYTGSRPCEYDPRSGIWNNILLKSVTATISRAYGDGSMLTTCGWISGENVATLSDEDTTDSAISRMLATAAWGEATTAVRTIPTTGITGLYREARYRTEHTETAGEQVWIEGQWVDGVWVSGRYRTVTTTATLPTLTGLSPWGLYRLTVTLESRPVDSAGAPTSSGEWSAAGTRTHYILANIDGEAGIDWQTIEPTAGFETRIASSTVEVA